MTAQTLERWGLILLPRSKGLGGDHIYLAFNGIQSLDWGDEGRVRWTASGGCDGLDAVAFSRQPRMNGRFTAGFAIESNPGWPRLMLRPRRKHDLASRMLYPGYIEQHIHLGDTEFNANWHVACDEEDFAVVFLNPAIQSLLCRPPPELGPSTEWYFGEGWLRVIVHTPGWPETTAKAFEMLHEVRKLISPELNAYKHSPRQRPDEINNTGPSGCPSRCE